MHSKTLQDARWQTTQEAKDHCGEPSPVSLTPEALCKQLKERCTPGAGGIASAALTAKEHRHHRAAATKSEVPEPGPSPS